MKPYDNDDDDDDDNNDGYDDNFSKNYLTGSFQKLLAAWARMCVW